MIGVRHGIRVESVADARAAGRRFLVGLVGGLLLTGVLVLAIANANEPWLWVAVALLLAGVAWALMVDARIRRNRPTSTTYGDESTDYLDEDDDEVAVVTLSDWVTSATNAAGEPVPRNLTVAALVVGIVTGVAGVIVAIVTG
jgi:hypothetical protein